ncbi:MULTISPECIES: anthranilate synthase component I family protein [Microbacterium]|uniref:anthranilate synthase component I family protein n=1 Tax=Microbacterium TaxID=33882 RepID=UPI0027862B4D|nr:MULTISPECIES: anthranilate synthase component I family protein [Microbacterium]MDQ1084105.1 para-aminobenzoate synthetase component 1 [Microbacterium sp. SORGH_AS_0344]MDQ1170619.1 para-aminobenzoate synthetase component 1 [Microbacterium proteolyticum]
MPHSAPSFTRAAWVDPEAAFLHLFAGAPEAFWLDAGVDAQTGWSWMGTGHLDASSRPMQQDAAASGARGGEGGPFRGGWVGWRTYEGEGSWLRVDAMLAFDHASRQAYAVGDPALAERIADAPAPRDVAPAVDRGVASARVTPERYAELIAACRERIREGDAYQLCLTTRFTVPGAVDALAVFRRLRRSSTSHHAGFVRIGDTTLVSASPERFLEVRGGAVHTHPIKGTRPRAADPVRDAALADDLRSDAKERAENVMIVDLMRNDLSRVCEPSTVGVDRLLEVESYPHVHQLVSEVSGRLLPGTTVGGLLEAAFPAGSMTGAPKESAMQILAHLEAAPRGLYSGAFGWIGDDGSADLAMVIRSIVVEPDAAYVGAGGGITWRSVAASEVAEVGIKARAPLAALGAEVPPGW